MPHRILPELLSLSRTIGDPVKELVIHNEGNTSAKVNAERFYVKGTGRVLFTARAEDFAEVGFAPLLELVERKPNASPQQIRECLQSALTPGDPAPSRESFTHALLLSLPGIRFVAHTRPTYLNGVMASPRAEAFATTRLFPDHVILCGPRSLYVPYMDQGLKIAVEMRWRLEEYMNQYGEPPITILLGNYGMIALGQTSDQVLAATAMMQKASRIYVAAQQCGGVMAMPEEHIEKVLTSMRG
jgi:rhamnose utilization protein RhaD (predicted bifunctional aldolase and dehydrogenase)